MHWMVTIWIWVPVLPICKNKIMMMMLGAATLISISCRAIRIRTIESIYYILLYSTYTNYPYIYELSIHIYTSIISSYKLSGQSLKTSNWKNQWQIYLYVPCPCPSQSLLYSRTHPTTICIRGGRLQTYSVHSTWARTC